MESHFLFSNLNFEEINYLLENLEKKELLQGETLFKKGENLKGIYLIINGSFRELYHKNIKTSETYPNLKTSNNNSIELVVKSNVLLLNY